MPPVMRRRQIVIALASSPALAVAQTAASPTPVAGVDYQIVSPPQPVDTGDRIEVLDFFWYGCPHCFAFLPELEAWRKRLPPDVAYEHLPVAFNPASTPHSRIFYALQTLNRLDDMHVKVFDAIHVAKRRMTDTDEIADFMAANGIDRAKWLAIYNSFSVVTAANRAPQIWTAYGIDGTPTLGCDGKYLTSPSMVRAKSNAAALAVMDYLIDRARRERPRKKK